MLVELYKVDQLDLVTQVTGQISQVRLVVIQVRFVWLGQVSLLGWISHVMLVKFVMLDQLGQDI